jgi:hypothetical protein
MKLGEALDLARREQQVRSDIYTHDVLAWALYKNGRASEALAPMKEALRLGTNDARLFFHAGMIHRAIGDAARARRSRPGPGYESSLPSPSERGRPEDAGGAGRAFPPAVTSRSRLGPTLRYLGGRHASRVLG